jgi:predicted nuclease of predicted toxin-antitoxin system
MKLLFDENLSPKLPRLINHLFPGSLHVRDCNLKPDQSIQKPFQLLLPDK